MSTYGDLQAEIADELNRSDLSNQIKKSIQEAIRQLERNRFYFNEQIATTDTVVNQAFYPVPTDFIYEDVLNITYSNTTVPLRRVTKLFMEEFYDTDDTGIPQDFAIYTDQFQLGPLPDDVYVLTLHYVKRLPALSASGDTNAWLTDAYDLTKAAAKQYLYIHYLRNYQHADALASVVRTAISVLQGENERRITTGRVRPTYF